MPDGVNKVILVGNLGADPEMRYTANGAAITNFRLAVSRSYGSKEERKEETEWVSVTTWNKVAEFVGQYLNKGRKAYVEGRLQTRSWDGPDGQKRYKTEVVAEQVIPLDSIKGGRFTEDDGFMDPDDLPFD